MRYLISETPYIIGRFETGDTITISVYLLSTGAAETLTSNACTEVPTTGIFSWSTSNFTTQPTVKSEYLWEMTDGMYFQYGKIVLGGYVENIADVLADTNELQGNQGDWATATGFATQNPPSQNLNDYKADVSALALETSLTTHDNSIDSQLSSIQSDLDNPDQYKADVSSLAIEANIETHATSSLNAYDPPTRSEATADKNEIITQVDANETKIDSIPTNPLLTTDSRLDNLDTTISSRSSHTAADIWSVASRTLTSFGSLVSDIWISAIRTLTAGTKDSEIDTIKIKTDQMNFTGDDIQSVASNMRGTDGANTVAPDNAGIAAIPTTPLLSSDVRLDNLDASISSRADQNPPSQILNDYKASGFALSGEYDTEMARLDVVVSTRSSHSVADIWAHATRTLTSFGTIIADIWSYAIRTLTGEVTTDTASREASKATGFSVPNEYDAALASIQTDLDNPDQYKASGFATQNPPSQNLDDYKADVSLVAIETNVETHVTNSLNAYDPPTRLELTSDKNEIIVEVDANETKIDGIVITLSSMDTDISFIKDIEGGKWARVGTQMIFYKADNTTEIARFDITSDIDGNPIARTRV